MSEEVRCIEAVPAGSDPTPAGPVQAYPGDHVVQPSYLLEKLTDRDASVPMLRDAPGREAEGGRAPAAFSRGEAMAAVNRLAATLARLHLPLGSVVAIVLPPGTESCLALPAVERAGLLPCLVPIAWGEEKLAEVIEASDARAVLTQTRVGDLRPAETLCRIAASRFRVRHVLAFGPDVPDGVVDLDAAAVDAMPPILPRGAPETALATCEWRGGRLRIVLRRWPSLLAATAWVLTAFDYIGLDVLESCVAPDDLAGLTTGWLASLVSGAEFVCRSPLQPLAPALIRERTGLHRRHLVLPAWAEEPARALLDWRVDDTLVFVHSPDYGPPRALDPPPPYRYRIVDVRGFGEQAVFAERRVSPGAKPALARPRLAAPSRQPLLAVRTTSAGIELRGLAAETVDHEPGWRGIDPIWDGWRSLRR